MPYDGGDLTIKAEIQIDGVWTTITSRVRAVGRVKIKHAMSDGANGPETSILRCLIGNDDGWITEGNPASPWHPHIGRGTPIRMSLTGILSSDAGRFAGEIDFMEALYPGGSSSAMYIEAIGTWGTLAQSDEELRSAVFRSIAGSTPSELRPIAYWSMEDPAGSARFASAIAGGTAVAPSGEVSFAADSALAGSDPLPMFADGASVVFPVPAYTITNAWMVQIIASVPQAPGADTVIARIETGREGVAARYDIVISPSPPPSALGAYVYNSAGTLLGQALVFLDGTGPANPSPADFYGRPWSIRVCERISGGNITPFIFLSDAETGVHTNGTTSIAGAPSTVRSVNPFALAATDGITFGHVGVHADALLVTGPFTEDVVASAPALSGWNGERVDDRITRLARELGLAVTVVGGSNHLMGPQRRAKITDLFVDCQEVDGGLWSDDRADLGLIYRTGSHLDTQAAQVAVTRGSLTPDTRPVWDYRRIRNEWTVSRVNGSSSTQSDEDHVAKVRRRLKGSAILNVASDDVLDDQARWRVNVSTPPGPRYSSLGINLRNTDGALLADAVLELEAGDRLTISQEALPDQHPPGGADQMVMGWTEELDVDFWEFRPVAQPYRPFDLVGRWALLSHELFGSINASVTSIDIANTDITQPMLETDTALIGSGYSVTVGAEEMQVTAVGAATVTFGAVGTAAHSVNAQVTPGIPASVATGNLLLILAAIRNSGSGSPITPANYTRLPVFPTAANVAIFAKIATSGAETAPSITFSGSVAGADTSAQMIRLAGKWRDVDNILIDYASCLNTSAQNITVPGLPKPECDNAIIIGVGWRQDDHTSVATRSGFTEIGDLPTATGDDQGSVWDYQVQTTATAIAATPFVVTGGAAAISRGAIFALRCDYQTVTVTRGINGTTAASHSSGDAVTMTDPMRWGLM